MIKTTKILMSAGRSLAVVPPVLNKIETRLVGGIALNDTRSEVLTLDLVMNFPIDEQTMAEAGVDKVIVRGDSGAKPWGKQVYRIDGQDFALCPEGDVLGFVLHTRELDLDKTL